MTRSRKDDLKFLKQKRFIFCIDTGGGSVGDPGGVGGAAGKTDPNPGKNDPPNPGQGQPNPGADPATIAKIMTQATEEAKRGWLSALGFSSEDELKTALGKIKKGGNNQTDDDETALRNVNANLQQQLNTERCSNAVAYALHGKELNDANLVRESIMKYISIGNDGNIVIKDDSGGTRYNTKTGNRLTVDEFVTEYLNGKPWLLKNPVVPGAGIDPQKAAGNTGKTDVNERMAELGRKDIISMEDIEKARGKK